MKQLSPAEALDFLLKKEGDERSEEENEILLYLISQKKSMDDLEKKQKERAEGMSLPFRYSYYDTVGNPISMWEWSSIQEIEIRHIAKDQIGPYQVSTIWLGLNHNHYLNGSPPLIFETMIFTDDDNDLNHYQERYSTKEQAREGHEIACQLCREKI